MSRHRSRLHYWRSPIPLDLAQISDGIERFFQPHPDESGPDPHLNPLTILGVSAVRFESTDGGRDRLRGRVTVTESHRNLVFPVEFMAGDGDKPGRVRLRYRGFDHEAQLALPPGSWNLDQRRVVGVALGTLLAYQLGVTRGLKSGPFEDPDKASQHYTDASGTRELTPHGFATLASAALHDLAARRTTTHPTLRFRFWRRVDDAIAELGARKPDNIAAIRQAMPVAESVLRAATSRFRMFTGMRPVALEYSGIQAAVPTVVSGANYIPAIVAGNATNFGNDLGQGSRYGFLAFLSAGKSAAWSMNSRNSPAEARIDAAAPRLRNAVSRTTLWMSQGLGAVVSASARVGTSHSAGRDQDSETQALAKAFGEEVGVHALIDGVGSAAGLSWSVRRSLMRGRLHRKVVEVLARGEPADELRDLVSRRMHLLTALPEIYRLALAEVNDSERVDAVGLFNVHELEQLAARVTEAGGFVEDLKFAPAAASILQHGSTIRDIVISRILPDAAALTIVLPLLLKTGHTELLTLLAARSVPDAAVYLNGQKLDKFNKPEQNRRQALSAEAMAQYTNDLHDACVRLLSGDADTALPEQPSLPGWPSIRPFLRLSLHELPWVLASSSLPFLSDTTRPFAPGAATLHVFGEAQSLTIRYLNRAWSERHQNNTKSLTRHMGGGQLVNELRAETRSVPFGQRGHALIEALNKRVLSLLQDTENLAQRLRGDIELGMRAEAIAKKDPILYELWRTASGPTMTTKRGSAHVWRLLGSLIGDHPDTALVRLKELFTVVDANDRAEAKANKNRFSRTKADTSATSLLENLTIDNVADRAIPILEALGKHVDIAAKNIASGELAYQEMSEFLDTSLVGWRELGAENSTVLDASAADTGIAMRRLLALDEDGRGGAGVLNALVLNYRAGQPGSGVRQDPAHPHRLILDHGTALSQIDRLIPLAEQRVVAFSVGSSKKRAKNVAEHLAAPSDEDYPVGRPANMAREKYTVWLAKNDTGPQPDGGHNREPKQPFRR
ncbi:MAG: hypothetical protein HOQ05_12345 [Corynebacteriales bacterium]|nr:hypothetical protein [Mycobacteriales bacterium]